MRVARRGGQAAASALLRRLGGKSPTFDGGTASTPPGFRRTERHLQVGDGDLVFRACVAAVGTWDMHRRAGLLVCIENARVQPGDDAVLGTPLGPVQVLAPCRVTSVIDEPRRGGFIYATLPGHPERGVEEFVVEQAADGSVWFTIVAISRHGSLMTALAGPVAGLIQRRITDRYAQAVVSVAGETQLG